MPRLLGERVMLREYKADDIGDIRKWVNDAETTRYLSTRFWPPQTMVDSEEFLSRMLQSSHSAYNFVIADRGDERYIGQLDMFQVDAANWVWLSAARRTGARAWAGRHWS